MSRTLTAVIGADTSGLTSALNEAKSALSSYRDAARQASGEIGRTASVSDAQVAALQRVVKALDKVQSGSMSTSQAQKSLQTQIAEMKIQWANLSDEAKNSDFGAALSETLSGAENALQQLREQIKIANEEVSNIGSEQPDTSNVTQSFEEIIASINAYNSSMREASNNEINTDESLTALSDLSDTLGEVESSSIDLSTAENKLKANLKQLAEQYVSLSDEAKQGEFGQALRASMETARQALRDTRYRAEEVQNVLEELNSTPIEQLAQRFGNLQNVIRDFSTGNVEGIATHLNNLRNINLSSAVSSITSLGTSAIAAAGPVGIAAGAVVAFGAAAKACIAKASEFEVHMDELSSLTGLTGDSLKEMGDIALDMSAKFGSSGGAIVDTMKLIGSQAPELIKDSEALAAVTESANVLAKAGGISVEQAGKAITGVMNQMGASATEATEIINVLAAASQQGSADIQYLNTAFEKSGTAASSAGMSYTELAAAIETVGPKFSSADVAGSQLSSTLLSLSTQANDSFKPAVVGMQQALENLAAANMTDAEMVKLVGASNIGMLKTLLQSKDQYVAYTQTLQGTNTAYEQMETNMDNMEGAQSRLSAAWDALITKLGQSAAFVDIGEAIKSIINYCSDLIAQISPLVDAWDELWNSSSNVSMFESAISNAFNAIKAIINAVILVLKSIVAVILIVRRKWSEMTGALMDSGWMRPVVNAIKAVIDWVNNLINGIKKLFNMLSKEVDNVLKNKPASTNKKVNTSTKTTNTETNNVTTNTTNNVTTKVKANVKPAEGSIKKLEEDISKKQNELKLATNDKDRAKIKKDIDALTEKKNEIEFNLKYPKESLESLNKQISDKQAKINVEADPTAIRNLQAELNALVTKKNALEIEIKYPEGSLSRLEAQISNINAQIKVEADNKALQDLHDQLNDLTKKKQEQELKYTAVVDAKSIDDINEKISDHEMKVKATVIGSKDVQGLADSLKQQKEFHEGIVRSLQDQVSKIKQKQSLGGKLTSDESKLLSIYEQEVSTVDELGKSFDKASAKAAKVKLDKLKYDGAKQTFGAVKDVTGAVFGLANSWSGLAENWNDMSTFEKIEGAFNTVIGTIDSVISSYETIMGVIETFDAIKEASAATSVATAATEETADTAKTVTDTVNTQTRIANNTMEETSDIGKVAVNQGVAISEATASGASLPFPANIAAIAAGIAAVVAAFSMIASFADGGIVSSGSKIGDQNMVRVNGGEMILNGSQQERLFNMLNGGNGGNVVQSTPVGKVTFEIKGQKLRGVLKNSYRKSSKIG